MTAVMTADITIDEVCEQVRDHSALLDALEGAHHELTPSRVVEMLWDLTALRRRNGLSPYRQEVIWGVLWVMAPWSQA